ncbi:MAG: hypothetical protein J6S49_01175 [Erysipelotrichaceae bacterium]|nr:hypothetical protein [Erysipelotrichaceae bacterium]
MNREEMLEELLEEGYTQEEAEEKLKQYEEEEEHLAYFRFMEIYNKDK